MKAVVIGSSMLDIEVSNGKFNGACPENKEVSLFKGSNIGVFAGGAANTATILSSHHVTTDLYTQGPGSREDAWASDLFKRVVKANRVVYSNEGSLPIKIRGNQDNQVMLRIDCEEYHPTLNGFPALTALYEDLDRFDVVIISDYCKGLISNTTEDIIRKIIKKSKLSLVNSKRHDYRIWQDVDVITTNTLEAQEIFGTTYPDEIIRLSGANCCYITDGPNSVVFSDGKGIQSIEVDKNVSNVYVIGAGDSFICGIAMALLNGNNYHLAGQNGVQLAQKYVSKPRKSALR